MNTLPADFLGTGLVSYDAGVTWSNPFAPDKINFAFEIAAPTPTPTPTEIPTATPTVTPALSIDPSPLTAGLNFWFDIRLERSITQPFDFYIIADTQFGPYTLLFDERSRMGYGPFTGIFKTSRHRMSEELSARLNCLLPWGASR